MAMPDLLGWYHRDCRIDNTQTVVRTKQSRHNKTMTCPISGM